MPGLRSLALLTLLLPPTQDTAPPVRPAPTAGPELVQARLVTERAGWIAGTTQLVGVHFEIEAGWHLYWKGANDSGLPIRVEPSLPDGFSAGELLWPAPQRHVWPGDLVDHVYEQAVTLLLPVTVPEDLEEGADLTLRARLDWLVCEQACIPGKAEVTLTLPVAPAPAASDGAALIARARARLPRPLPPDIELDWSAGSLRVRAPGAVALAFFPKEDGLALEDVAGTCVGTGDTLVLRPDPAVPAPTRRLHGVLAVTLQDGADPSYYSVDLAAPDGT